MRSITVGIAALLVVLAGYGIAEASVLTLSIEFGTTQLSLDGSNGPLTTTYTVKGAVTGNTTDDAGKWGEVLVLNGGISSVTVDQYYTSSNGGQIKQPGSPAAGFPASVTAANPPFNGSGSKGSTVNAGRVPAFGGAGGIDNTYVSRSPFSGVDDYVNFDNYPAVSVLPTFAEGNGTAITLYTGSITAIANGTVNVLVDRDLDLVGLISATVYKLNAGGLYIDRVDTIVPATATIYVGNQVTNVAPVIDSIVPSSVTEADWTREPGWNNLEHKVIAPIVATAHDDDAGDTLSYTWILESSAALPGGGQTLPVGENSAILNLSLQDLVNAGFVLPLYVGDNDPTYDWILTLTIDDGNGHSATSADIPVFVPEPATMGLLAFGVVALLRRRRRA